MVRTTLAQTASSPPIDELVQDLQAKYASVQDFSADFEHRYRGGLINTSLVEHGTVVIKKPGKMRWQYTSSEEKLYVSDGETFYSYYPVDRQVLMTTIPADDRASTPTLFLAGQGDLVNDFTARYEAEVTGPPNTWMLRLTPKVADTDYEWLVLAIHRETLSIVGLSTVDFQGGESTYYFTNLRENEGIADRVFQFEVPDDVDVIDETGTLR